MQTQKKVQMNGIEMRCAIADPTWVARLLIDQCASLPKSVCRSRADMFLNDGHALGYAYGFSAQASRHAHGAAHDEMGRKYIEKVFAAVLEDTNKAQSFVTFSRFQFDDLNFDSGSATGIMDLNDWVMSHGSARPNGLVERYQ